MPPKREDALAIRRATGRVKAGRIAGARGQVAGARDAPQDERIRGASRDFRPPVEPQVVAELSTSA
jgi:hypothetical protein